MKFWIATLLLALALAGITENYYDLLGVPKNANDEQIKKAFKKLSMKFHPDRNKSDREIAQKQYAKISTAYDVLIDLERRRAYDRNGEKGVSDWEQDQAAVRQQKEWRSLRKAHNVVYPSIYGGMEVFEVEEHNFEELKRKKVWWLANFYHPTCGHCQQYKAEYNEIAKKLAGIVLVTAINCSSNFDFCQDMWIQEYPSILLFPPDPSEPYYRYSGDRSIDPMLDFVSARLPNYAVAVTKNNFDEFLRKRLPKVLFFNGRRYPPPLLKFISRELASTFEVAEIVRIETEITEKFAVTEFPTVIKIANGKTEKYAGEMLAKPLLDWIINSHEEVPSVPVSSVPTSSIPDSSVPVPSVPVPSVPVIPFDKLAVTELTPELQTQGICHPSDPTICVIIFSDSEASQPVLFLKSIAEGFKKERIAFLWVDNMKYPKALSQFAGAAGIILRAKKHKVLRIANLNGLQEILFDVATGAGNFEPLSSPLLLSSDKSDL